MAARTIDLNFKGQQLIDAVKTVADIPVVNPIRIDRTVYQPKELTDRHFTAATEVSDSPGVLTVYRLGQVSEFINRHFEVLAGDKGNTVNPDMVYSSFMVRTFTWQYWINGESFNEDVAKRSANILADQIQHEIERSVILRQQSELPIRFRFENTEYQCSYEAYIQKLIILPDGRILAAESWLESFPPQPMDLKVIGMVGGAVAMAL